MTTARPLAFGLSAFAGVVGACFAFFSSLDLPTTGRGRASAPRAQGGDARELRPGGELDAIVVGSSIVDFGFSAELFSKLMSAHLGREYRMFNFASGGAEPRTLPALYRFARLAGKPKAVFVLAPAEPKLRNTVYERSPDYTLQNAPVAGPCATSACSSSAASFGARRS